jgi:octaprenyl-diphosphate synthase
MSRAPTIADLVAPVAPGLARMREILRRQVVEGAAGSGAVRDMVDHVGRFQGKQLRGALVLLSGEATGNTTDEHAAVAAIVELIHLATLVHDDVLDGARIRRRVACVNERWDNQTAVLLGDFLYVRAFALSTELSSRLASRVLAETTRRICVGEIEQSMRRYDFEADEPSFLALCGAKTAALYAAACELGTRYPGGHEELGARMRAVGWDLGLAFQLVDDCLDLTGAEAVVGKTVGTDVADGKVTLPVLYTFARASEAARARMREIYTRPGLENRAALLRAECSLEAGIEYTLARAAELVERVRHALAELEPSPARRSLEGIAGFVLERDW